VCVFITAGPINVVQICSRGGGGILEDMCYERLERVPGRSEQGKPWPGPPTWAAILCLDCSLGLADDYVTTKLPLQSPKSKKRRRAEACVDYSAHHALVNTVCVWYFGVECLFLYGARLGVLNQDSFGCAKRVAYPDPPA
jgi:hypothetical protein